MNPIRSKLKRPNDKHPRGKNGTLPRGEVPFPPRIHNKKGNDPTKKPIPGKFRMPLSGLNTDYHHTDKLNYNCEGGIKTHGLIAGGTAHSRKKCDRDQVHAVIYNPYGKYQPQSSAISSGNAVVVINFTSLCSGDNIIKVAPNNVSGRVVKTLIILFES